jgi:hypothetical protein
MPNMSGILISLSGLVLATVPTRSMVRGLAASLSLILPTLREDRREGLAFRGDYPIL